MAKSKPKVKKLEDLKIGELEEHLRDLEVRLSAYLHDRGRYRLSDTTDILEGKKFAKIVKTPGDLRMFIHWQYYQGKWAAYNAILQWIQEKWHGLTINPADGTILRAVEELKRQGEEIVEYCYFCKQPHKKKDLLSYVDVPLNTMFRVCWKCVGDEKNKINTDYVFKKS